MSAKWPGKSSFRNGLSIPKTGIGRDDRSPWCMRALAGREGSHRRRGDGKRREGVSPKENSFGIPETFHAAGEAKFNNKSACVKSASLRQFRVQISSAHADKLDQILRAIAPETQLLTQYPELGYLRLTEVDLQCCFTHPPMHPCTVFVSLPPGRVHII